MTVRFLCTRCGQRLRVGDELAGGLVRCPGCNIRLDVPLPAPKAASATARSSGPESHDEPPLIRPLPEIDHEELIDMTAMVDIVFFLLIFFLVTSMQSLDSSIPMPSPDPQKGAGREQQSLEDIESDDDYVVVRIDRHDAIQVDGVPVLDAQDLVAKLRELRSSPRSPTKMLVVGSGEASHGMAVVVLDSGHEAGMERVRLAISDENE